MSFFSNLIKGGEDIVKGIKESFGFGIKEVEPIAINISKEGEDIISESKSVLDLTKISGQEIKDNPELLGLKKEDFNLDFMDDNRGYIDKRLDDYIENHLAKTDMYKNTIDEYVKEGVPKQIAINSVNATTKRNLKVVLGISAGVGAVAVAGGTAVITGTAYAIHKGKKGTAQLEHPNN